MSEIETARWRPNIGAFLMRYKHLDLYFHYDDKNRRCSTVTVDEAGDMTWQECFTKKAEEYAERRKDTLYPGHAPHMAARRKARELRWLNDDGQAWRTGIDKVPE